MMMIISRSLRVDHGHCAGVPLKVFLEGWSYTWRVMMMPPGFSRGDHDHPPGVPSPLDLGEPG